VRQTVRLREAERYTAPYLEGIEFYSRLRSLLSRFDVFRSFPLFFKPNSWISSRFLLNPPQTISQYLLAILRRIKSCSYAERSVGKEYYFSIIILSGLRLSALGTAATTGLL
jgi:hypothetical protein